MRFLTLILAVLIVFPVFGQRSKKKEEETEVITYNEGIAYALPRTGVKINISAIEVAYTPGPYAAYADELLGIQNIKIQPSSSWSIDNITLDVFSEPDPAAVYKTSGDVASLISLSSNGCLLGLNKEVSEANKMELKTNKVSYDNKDLGIQFTNLSDSPFYTPGDSTNRFRVTKLNIQQKATQAAARILECRLARFETSIGYLDELPPDGKAYEESLEELAKIENDFLALFIGKKSGKRYSYTFDYIPSAKSVKGEVVFRFSEQKGVLEKSDLTGKPVMIDIERVDALANNLNGKVSSENPYAGESGIYYRMPGIGKIKVMYELKTIATARSTIAQFGAVAPVPEGLLDGSYQLEFSPETGAIKSVIQK